MERVVGKFKSHTEAAEADKNYMLSLSPAERIAIAKEIIARVHPNIDQLPDIRAYHKLYGRPAFILKRR